MVPDPKKRDSAGGGSLKNGPQFEPLQEQDSRMTQDDGGAADLLEALEDDLPVPPDGGWGWVVVAASFIIHVIADGVAYSFGVFIVEFLDYFPGSGRGELGWISSLMVGVTLGSGPIASTLTNKYGCRIVTIVGSFIASFGFLISIWAPNIYYLYFSFGITAGFGLGLIYLPAIVSVTYYFEKKRAFATGLAVCGSGIGTFVFAPLTKMLMDEFGWRGASLILSGLLLNCVVCGALFRPLEPRSKSRKRRTTNDLKCDNMVLEVQENGSVRDLSSNGKIANGLPPTIYKHNGTMISNSAHNIPTVADRLIEENMKMTSSEMCLRGSTMGSSTGSRLQVPSQHSHSHVMDRKDILYTGSLNNIPLYRSNPALYSASVSSLHKISGGPEEDEPSSSSCCCCQCSPEVKEELSSMMDISLLRDPLFLMFAISNFFTSIGFNSPYIYLPDKATQLGISYEKASFLISMIGIFNTIGRVVFGFLSDRKFVNRLMLYNTALTLCGICTALSALCVTYPWLLAYSAAYGLFIGVYVSLTSVVLVDLLGLERLTSSFGLLLLFQGIATIVGPPLCGFVYDATKDYAASFYIIGSMIAVSGAMLYFIPCVRRCTEKRHAVSKHDMDMGRVVATTNVI